jgi:hypothetical protein
MTGSGGPEENLITGSSADAVAPQVAMDASGEAIAVWSRFCPSTAQGCVWTEQAASHPAGGAWTRPVTLAMVGHDNNRTHRPQLAVDAHGDALAVWPRFNRAGHQAIEAVSRPAGGTWTRPVNLSPAGQHAQDPQVAMAMDGRAIVVWSTSDERVDWVETTRPAAPRPPVIAATGTPTGRLLAIAFALIGLGALCLLADTRIPQVRFSRRRGCAFYRLSCRAAPAGVPHSQRVPPRMFVAQR